MNGHTGDQPTGEAHVLLRLYNDGIEPDKLEDHAFAVLETIQRDAADVALGAVVACDFASGSIELEFDVAAAAGSEVHRLIGQVLDVVEKELPLAREAASETATRPLACA